MKRICVWRNTAWRHLSSINRLVPLKLSLLRRAMSFWQRAEVRYNKIYSRAYLDDRRRRLVRVDITTGNIRWAYIKNRPTGGQTSFWAKCFNEVQQLNHINKNRSFSARSNFPSIVETCRNLHLTREVKSESWLCKKTSWVWNNTELGVQASKRWNKPPSAQRGATTSRLIKGTSSQELRERLFREED